METETCKDIIVEKILAVFYDLDLGEIIDNLDEYSGIVDTLAEELYNKLEKDLSNKNTDEGKIVHLYNWLDENNYFDC